MWVEMPLCYTHVCTACGAEMDVYDRSYWMELACAGCGTPFLAKPPEEATE
jgi:DNA-directed RNA polymerase subunit RPC12/RpoP